MHPTTLTVAAGSADGETARLMSTIATRLASTNAPVRLQVVDKGNALDAAKAFSGGQADLAVLRADVGDLSSAETVVVVTRAVARRGGSATSCRNYCGHNRIPNVRRIASSEKRPCCGTQP
jgi:hypothetical protein